MNQPSVPLEKRYSNFLRWFGGIVFALVLLILLLALGVISCFWLSSDTRTLRNGLLASSGVDWHQQIALNVGGLTLDVARTGLSLVPLDEHARAVLRSVRGMQIGIYQLSAVEKSPDRSTMLSAVDEVMVARGWERVVVVMAERELVAVYLPQKLATAQRLNCCVTAFDGEQMLIASARINPEPLVQCLLKEASLRANTQ